MLFDLATRPAQPPLLFDAADRYAHAVLQGAREVPDRLVIARDIPYGPHPAQRYDVFGDPDAHAQPILVFWHGGGWTNGYKEWCAFMAQAAAAHGVRLVAPDYRLAPAHRLPAAYEDCLRLLGHVVAHAPSFGGDPSRLVLSGHSAGGHLAALCAVRPDGLARHQVPEEAILGCMPVSAILDLQHPAPVPGTLEEMVYTTVLDDPLDDVVMSPIMWTRGNKVPMLLCYGEQDSERVRRSNLRMARLLGLQQGRIERVVLPATDHFQAHMQLADPASPWYALLKTLL